MYAVSVYRPCNTASTWAGDESYKSDSDKLQSPMASSWCMQGSTKAGGWVCRQWIKEERGGIVSTKLCTECCNLSWALLHQVYTRGVADNLWHAPNNSWKRAHSSALTARYSSLYFQTQASFTAQTCLVLENVLSTPTCCNPHDDIVA